MGERRRHAKNLLVSRRATDQSDGECAASMDHSFGEMEFLNVRGYVPSAWCQVLEFAVELETEFRLSALQLDSTIGDHGAGPGHARVVPITANRRCASRSDETLVALDPNIHCGFLD